MRVAVVGYINALPLTWGLPWPIDRLVPAALAGDALQAYDLILAPVVTAWESPAWEILNDAPAIGCCGAVGSVRLEFTLGKDLATALTFALSPESRTSNLLLAVLLREYWGKRDAGLYSARHGAGGVPPEGPPVGRAHAPRGRRLCSRPADYRGYKDRRASENSLGGNFPGSCDATLVIGDRALSTQPPAQSIDLGQAWHEWTGLPFVFAAWMSKAAVAPKIAATLRTTRDRNLANPHAFVTQVLAHHPHAGPPPQLLRYFTEQLVYEFGPRERAGLARFSEYAHCHCEPRRGEAIP